MFLGLRGSGRGAGMRIRGTTERQSEKEGREGGRRDQAEGGRGGEFLLEEKTVEER